MRTDVLRKINAASPITEIELNMMSSAVYKKGLNTRTTSFYSESVSKTNEKKLTQNL